VGPTSTANYAYVYNEGAETVPIGSSIDFDSNGPLLGFTHAPGTDGIVAITAGVYLIDFSVSGVEPGQFALFDNGALISGSTYGSGAGTQINSGQVLVTLSPGDVVTLVNHVSAAAVTLQTLAGGSSMNVNASVLIDQVG
jgi:hypothetical protein